MLQKLINEHEMGELFKVIGFAANTSQQPYNDWQALGFAQGDRSHTL
jgi:SAM-dependent MidA family methyltransferase